MNYSRLSGELEPDETVGFGDVTPGISAQRTESEEQTGLQESAAEVGDTAETGGSSDSALGITSERLDPTEGEVDTTPLARRD